MGATYPIIGACVAGRPVLTAASTLAARSPATPVLTGHADQQRVRDVSAGTTSGESLRRRFGRLLVLVASLGGMLYALTAFQECEHSIFPLRFHCRGCRRLGPRRWPPRHCSGTRPSATRRGVGRPDGDLMKPVDIAVRMIALAGHAKAVRFLRETEDYADITSPGPGRLAGARGQACGIDTGQQSPVPELEIPASAAAPCRPAGQGGVSAGAMHLTGWRARPRRISGWRGRRRLRCPDRSSSCRGQAALCAPWSARRPAWRQRRQPWLRRHRPGRPPPGR
jgi:hypothetical protein